MQAIGRATRLMIEHNRLPLINAVTKRNRLVVSGPPRTKISHAERLAHGLAIVIGCSIVPIYVLVNLKNYRAGADQS